MNFGNTISKEGVDTTVPRGGGGGGGAIRFQGCPLNETLMAVRVELHTNWHGSTGRTTHQLAWQYRLDTD